MINQYDSPKPDIRSLEILEESCPYGYVFSEDLTWVKADKDGSYICVYIPISSNQSWLYMSIIMISRYPHDIPILSGRMCPQTMGIFVTEKGPIKTRQVPNLTLWRFLNWEIPWFGVTWFQEPSKCGKGDKGGSMDEKTWIYLQPLKTREFCLSKLLGPFSME